MALKRSKVFPAAVVTGMRPQANLVRLALDTLIVWQELGSGVHMVLACNFGLTRLVPQGNSWKLAERHSVEVEGLPDVEAHDLKKMSLGSMI